MTSLLTSLTRLSAAPEPAYVETVPWNSALTATTWASANNAVGVLLPKRATALTIARLGVEVATASGNIDLGLYTWDGSQWVRQRSTGSTAAAGTNAMQYVALGAAYVYDGRADTWLWVAADNTTISLLRLASASAVAGIGNRCVLKASAFPLPATIASGAAQSSVPYGYAGA